MKFSHFSVSKRLNLLMGLVVLLFVAGCQKELAVDETSGNDQSLQLKAAKVTNLMVITRSETLPAGFEAQLSTFGVIVSSTPKIGVVVIAPRNADVVKQIEGLKEVQAIVPDLNTRWVDPVKVVEDVNPPSIGTNEPYFYRLWGMDVIDAPEAWNEGYRGAGARVFILDSGIDADNPDLAPNLNQSLSTSFVPGEGFNVATYSQAFFNHGTHVAGTIAAADNTWGVIGVAPNAEIVAVKVLSESTGSGNFSWINAGIVYAAQNGADVINMSIGARFNRNGFYLDDNDVWQKIPAVYMQNLIVAQQRAVNYAVRMGATVIVSAGNDYANNDGNGSTVNIPADLQNVIAVSATAPHWWYYDYYYKITGTIFDYPASYSNFGKSLVTVAAPGGDELAYPKTNWSWDMILSNGVGPYPGSDGKMYYPFFYAEGTSMAAPHVSGVAALIIGKNGGQMNPVEVTQKIVKTADKIDGNGISAFYGKGRVNAFRAVTE
jgi:subtilisin family serine protease